MMREIKQKHSDAHWREEDIKRLLRRRLPRRFARVMLRDASATDARLAYSTPREEFLMFLSFKADVIGMREDLAAVRRGLILISLQKNAGCRCRLRDDDVLSDLMLIFASKQDAAKPYLHAQNNMPPKVFLFAISDISR